MAIEPACGNGGGRGSRAWRAWYALGLALCLGAGVGPVQAAGAPDASARVETQVEAAFLVNFVRFTQWPPGRFDGPLSPYVVSVVGTEDVVSAVQEVAEAAGDVQGRRIVVRRVRGASPQAQAALRGSHLVFVHRSATEPVREVLAAVRGASVLTVGDQPGFLRDGGMLVLHREAGRLGFAAQPSVIQASGLRVSSKVLKLAQATGGVRR